VKAATRKVKKRTRRIWFQFASPMIGFAKTSTYTVSHCVKVYEMM
jgi:hypothetical protein